MEREREKQTVALRKSQFKSEWVRITERVKKEDKRMSICRRCFKRTKLIELANEKTQRKSS